MTIATAFCAQAVMNILASHALKIALIKPASTGVYGLLTSNYSDLTGNGDEVTGTGYTVGGAAISGMTVAATAAGNVAYLNFTNPAWTGASFSAGGALIYDTTAGNRAIAVIDFGETLTPAAGTLTIQLPANDFANALIRISSQVNVPT